MSPVPLSRIQQPPYPPPPLPPLVDPNLPPVHVTPPMVYVEPTFEYKTVTRQGSTEEPPLSETEMNELGKAGWELVSILSDGRVSHFYFKRVTA